MFIERMSPEEAAQFEAEINNSDLAQPNLMYQAMSISFLTMRLSPFCTGNWCSVRGG
jgi:hypothetical protein